MAEIALKGKIRTILLPNRLCRKLQKYAKKHKIASGEIFITRSGMGMGRKQIWTEMKKLCRSAGVERDKVYPHNLRSLFARSFYSACHNVVRWRMCWATAALKRPGSISYPRERSTSGSWINWDWCSSGHNCCFVSFSTNTLNSAIKKAPQETCGAKSCKTNRAGFKSMKSALTAYIEIVCNTCLFR